MDKEQYALAEQCFRRAGQLRECAIAQAYLLRESAETASEYLTAAQAFRACAASSPVTTESSRLILASAACYGAAKDHSTSARLYLEAGDIGASVRQYCAVPMMEEARRLITRYPGDARPADIDKVGLYLFRNKMQR